MSSSFGSMGGGPLENPPAIFGPQVPGQSVEARVEWEPQFSMEPLTMVLTDDPVWPQDEALEKRASAEAGREFPLPATADIAAQMANDLRVELPDRLLGQIFKLPPHPGVAADAYDYIALYFPTTFSAWDMIPRRMSLEVKLEGMEGVPEAPIPIFVALHPGTDVASEVTNLGEFRIDFGQAVNLAMQNIWPDMPQLLTAKTGGSLDLNKVHAKVLAAGKGKHWCEWRISDTKIAYDFNPACVIQIPTGLRLAVTAELNVEVRKKVALLFYRTYFRSSQPKRYVLAEQSSDSSRLPDTDGGKEVVLRQPSDLAAEEKSVFSDIMLDTVSSAYENLDFIPLLGASSLPSIWEPPGLLLPHTLNYADLISRVADLNHNVPVTTASTGDVVAGDSDSPQEAASAVPEQSSEIAARIHYLSELSSMLLNGSLTREEFEILKARLLSGL